MDREQTCCVTGHRVIPAEKNAIIQSRLREEVMEAISRGFTHFISGFAPGVDLMFSEIVVELKTSSPITLEAAIPCPDRIKTHEETFQRLIKCCDEVIVHSDHYFRGCHMLRNRYMVDRSAMVIAVWDGRNRGGTAATIRYAIRKNVDIRIIQYD